MTARGLNHSLWRNRVLAFAMTETREKSVLKMTRQDRNRIQGVEPRLSDGERNSGNDGIGTGLATKTKPKVKKPDLYRVLLLNDDFTPMEFVIHILERFFRKSPEEAQRIMLHVHNNGVGECGVYTYEVAETKVTQVMDFARKNQHPLQCVMEKK